MPNFKNIDYLKIGSYRQKAAYGTLTKHCVFEKLKDFDPILTGTIPINIDIPESDLDIICYWKNKDKFILTLQNHFSIERDFHLTEFVIDDNVTIVANFYIDDFELEIFGQNIPTINQNAFLHMVIEHQILTEKGEDFRQHIIELKLQGIKTEPAFAKLLGLIGNPYQALLNYKID